MAKKSATSSEKSSEASQSKKSDRKKNNRKSTSQKSANSRASSSFKKVKNTPNPRPPQGMSKEKYDRLVAEAKAPFKGFRKFIYGAAGASGAVGGFVFITQIIAGRDLETAIPNLAVQLGVIGIVVFLFRWEDRNKSDDD